MNEEEKSDQTDDHSSTKEAAQIENKNDENVSTPVIHQKWQTLVSLFNFSHSVYHGLRSLPNPQMEQIATSTTHTHSSEHTHCLLDDILCVRVDMIDNDIDQICIDPFVRIHLCNATTGNYISNLNASAPFRANGNGHGNRNSCDVRRNEHRRVYDEPFATTYPASHNNVSVTPVKTSAKHHQNQSAVFRWDVEIVMKHSYQRILDPHTLLLFEVMDCGWMNPSPADMNGKMAKSIVWGYLKPMSIAHNCINVGTRKGMSTNSDACVERLESGQGVMKQCRLQLLKWQNDSWFVQRQAKRLLSQLVPKVYLQYLRRQFVEVGSSLYVNIGPTLWNSQRDTTQAIGLDHTKRENHSRNLQDEGRSGDMEGEASDLSHQYKRLPEEKCLIPDSLHLRLTHPGDGVATLSFSNSGNLLAVANKSHDIHVYNLSTRAIDWKASHCHHGDILSLTWSMDDTTISCASMDGTISTHQVQKAMTNEEEYKNDLNRFNVLLFVEPPEYPTIIKAMKMPMIVAGLSDGSVSLWHTTKDRPELELLSGIKCHTSPVRALETDYSNGRIFTGDDDGKIVVWKSATDDYAHGTDFKVLLQLDTFREIVGKSILHLSLSPETNSTGNAGCKKSRQLLITTKQKVNTSRTFVYDFTCHEFSSFGINTEVKHSLIKIATFSPDGRYVLGGTEDGKIILMDSSGILSRTVSNANAI